MELEEGTDSTSDISAPATIVSWLTIRHSIAESAIRKLFPGSTSRCQFFDASECFDPGLMELAATRYVEVYGAAPPLSLFPCYFLRCCYAEYYYKRPVDYKAVIDSRKRRKMAAAIDIAAAGNEKITIKPPGAMTNEENKNKDKKPIAGNAPKRPRSRIYLLAKLQAANEELKAANARCAELEHEVVEHKRQAWRPRMVLTPPLEELRGPGGLGPGFSGEERRKECPVCFARFSSEGWYRLGSCGHEYHLQCLMLHALCAPSCVVCQAELPVEVYKGIGLEEHRPKTL